jgi:hypothetical protein
MDIIANFNDKKWNEIDSELFNGHILQALIKIRENFGVGLGDSIFMADDRFQFLVLNQKEKFQVDIKTYWEGFYS